jgi:hypothetical protein
MGYRVNPKILSFTSKTMELLSHKLNFKGIFPDKCLDKGAEIIASQFIYSRNSIVKGITKSEVDQKGFYLFLGSVFQRNYNLFSPFSN